jgi:leader peptidase (prepilin peptidase)/N-methyltransferase
MITVAPLTLSIAFACLFGLAIGSFLNVVIYRVPAGESVVHPPSRCPSCARTIRNRHNIPVLSWLQLRGKCADCANPISARYPLIEAATAVLFVAVTVRLAGEHLGAAVPAYLYLAAAGLALAMIDVDHRRLPDAIVLPSYAVAAVLLTVSSALTHDWWALARAAISAGVLFSAYFAIVVAYPAGMGFGDVKLAGFLGALLGYLSWSTLIVGAFAGFVFGAVVGVAIIAARHGDRKTAIPFGPFMIAGALMAVFVGQPALASWLSVTGRA